MTEKQVTLHAVGDILIGGSVKFPEADMITVPRPEPESAFALTVDFLRGADITFGNLEGALSARNKTLPGRQAAIRCSPDAIKALTYAQFDVLNFANNHSMDFGPEAFVETLECLERNGIPYIGGGRNIKEALRPAVVERNGLKVAFVGCATNLNAASGYRAGPDKPGCAPSRVSAYLPGDQLNQEDLAAVVASIKAAKEIADVVIASCHWGVSDGGTQTLAIHQKALGRHLIDAGAAMVLGHHPHIQQAIEIYRGRPICYSLGNFVFDWGGSPMPKTTISIEAILVPQGVKSLRYLPTAANAQGTPYFPTPDDPLFRSIGENVQALSREVNTTARMAGNAWEIELQDAAQ